MFHAFTVDHEGLTFYFKDQLAYVVANAVIPTVSWRDLEPLLLAETPEGLPRDGVPGAAAEPPVDWCRRDGAC